MDLVRVTPPGADILTLDEAKLHLGVQSNDENDLILGLIAAATSWLDGPTGLLGRCLIAQSWRLYFDYAFPSWRIPLPLTPLISVESIEYVDADGIPQTLDPSVYQVLDGRACAIQPAYGKAWVAPRSQARAITVNFTAGYGETAAEIPAPIVVAMKLLIAHFYMNREASVGIDQRGTPTPLPIGVAELLAPYRARSIA